MALSFMKDLQSRISTRFQLSTDSFNAYSDAIAVMIKPMLGDPKRSKISTSYVERQNLTMRMQIRRFTRLTNAFSKKLINLKAALAIHFFHYNFMRVHQTLRVTPSMEAGITRSHLINSF
jgi:IS1 family transposase